ncbi:helix-turn-helix domain-containing protein [Butyrivibrio sp. YAB3001]|uniref:helix-turn-helix domain-containing protein n=1 Tax=Butyrivibrio sp. YAB3001 TaxID=1520812 RepID=UPI0008F688DF|nr:helix-turn-helix transcriptional regulator [Butyrivibrio sp. YAB3001]SFC42141.1 Helix-turn-helix [Butyrivibrio sp. YAB3001]
MDIEEAVKQRILDLCKEYGLTVNALSVKAGMPRSTLKNIIYGTSKNTGIITIQLVCDALGISIYDFFSDDLFKNIDPVKD